MQAGGHKLMEDLTMTLAKVSKNWIPSFPSLLDSFFDERELMEWNNNLVSRSTTIPAVNISETADEYNIELAAPGMQKDDFKIEYDNGKLAISSEKKEEHEENNHSKVYRREFSYQSFKRSFSISENIANIEAIEAKYEKGILRIRIPKHEHVKPKAIKQIEIS